MTDRQDDSGALRERHVAVLRDMMRLGPPCFLEGDERAAIDAAIAALSRPAIAPQGEVAAWEYRLAGDESGWCRIKQDHYDMFNADPHYAGRVETRALYAAPQATPAAVDDAMVERLAQLIGDKESRNRNDLDVPVLQKSNWRRIETPPTQGES